MTKKRWVRLLAFVLALLMPVMTATVAFAEEGDAGSASSDSKVSKYDSPDVNVLTGHGQEPEELSVSAGAEYLEKAWYEYVTYSDKAVCSYRLNDDSRLLFYDPYTYTNAMIMDVQFDATTSDLNTMSSYTVSHTTERSATACLASTETYTSETQTSGRDYSHSDVKDGGQTKTVYNHSLVNETSGTKTDTTSYEYRPETYWTISTAATASTGAKESASATAGVNMSATVGTEISVSASGTLTQTENTAWLTDKVNNETVYSADYKTSTNYEGDDTVEYYTESHTDGWTELSARITKTIGSSTSVSNSWSEKTGTTVSKTYAATHFASDGVTPLPWAIVHYTVQMPLKCCMQVKYSGEWVTISTVYCLLTTVQGTCRAWMQNGQVYYEDWGSGEPVVATDFWGQFLTKDQLINAYSDKLYPTGGAD